MRTHTDAAIDRCDVSGLPARREERKHILGEELRRITVQLAGLGALRVIVFGSCAADTVGISSDLDLIAVMPETRTGREWRRNLPDMLDYDVGCDLLVYTEREFGETLPVSSFSRHAVSTGKTVYEKGS